MGFEFETLAHVAHEKHNYRQLVTDEEVFYRQNDWKILSDCGRMEFVSEPLVTKNELQTACNEVQQFITSVVNAGPNDDIRQYGNGTWDANAVGTNGVFVAKDGYMTTQVTAEDLHGHPQVSVGIETTKLAKFLRQAQRVVPLGALRGEMVRLWKQNHVGVQIPDPIRRIGSLVAESKKQALAPVHQRVDALIRRHANNIDSRKLRGLWTLMMTYWELLQGYSGDGTESYKKSRLTFLSRWAEVF